MLWKKNGSVTSGNYRRFTELLQRNQLKPRKPIETLEGVQRGDLSLPDELVDPNVEIISKEELDCEMHFYKGVPKLEELEAYKDQKAGNILKGGESHALRILDLKVKESKK